MQNSPSRVPVTRRGALSTGLVIGIVLGVIVLIVGGMAVSRYNALATGRTVVDSGFAKIESAYKRRSDLIGQLVDTVKGSAKFEKATLDSVVQARSRVGQVQLPANAPEDPAELQKYIEAQQALSGAFSRLLVVAEQYPDIKSTAAFRDLQSQIEGSENRINAARIDYIEAVQNYNRSLVTFPGNIVAGIFNFKAIPQLAAATEEERKVPKIDLDISDDKEKK